MIIVEGMDNTGKSTLCEELIEELPFHSRFKLSHTTKPTNQDLTRFVKLAEEPGFGSKPLILDRMSFISELVYGPILREGSFYGDRNWGLLFNFMINNPFFLIYCRPPKEYILDNMGEQMPGVQISARRLTERYDEVYQILNNFSRYITTRFPKTRGMIIHYDWTSKNRHFNLEVFLKLYRESMQEK